MSHSRILKIYFARSIRAGRTEGDTNVFRKLVQELTKYGQVLNPRLGDDLAIRKEDRVRPDDEIYQTDLKMIDEANVIVADVTTPSLGVGYEIGRAHDGSKKILCLYRPREAPKKLSALIRGADEFKNLTVKDYEEAAIPRVLSDFFSSSN